MTKFELLQLIIEYGSAKEAQGQAFIDTTVDAESHRVYCDTSSTAFTKVVAALQSFEVRPF